MTQHYPQEETASPFSVILIGLFIIAMLVWNIYNKKKVNKPELETPKIEYRDKFTKEGRLAYG